MTTISIRMSGPADLTSEVRTAGISVFEQLARWFRSTWCVINGGHYKVLHTEPAKMALRCVACGHTSPGWSVGSPRFARTMPADPERLRLRRVAA
jgi:hypothetical protein